MDSATRWTIVNAGLFKANSQIAAKKTRVILLEFLNNIKDYTANILPMLFYVTLCSFSILKTDATSAGQGSKDVV